MPRSVARAPRRRSGFRTELIAVFASQTIAAPPTAVQKPLTSKLGHDLVREPEHERVDEEQRDTEGENDSGQGQ